jgi:hypothetical protein
MGGGNWEIGKTSFKRCFAQDNYKHWGIIQAN